MQTLPIEHTSDKFRQTLECIPAAAYTCDCDGLITFYNQRAAALWGRRPKLNDPSDRYCGSFKLFSIEGDPIPHDQCWMALALQNDREYNGQEIVIERPNGARWTALAHAKPFHDESGELIGAVNVLVDVTDRKRAATERSQLAAIVDSSDDAIISKDLRGYIQSWNVAAERLFGYTAEQVVGRHISLLIPPDRLDEEDRILARLRAGDRVYHFDTVRRRSDGRHVDVSLTISPVRDETGRIVGASKIARDISDRKRAEEQIYSLLAQLKEADHRKDEFLAMLAHELRNPLAPLLNLLEIMKLGGDNVLDEVRPTLERQLRQMVRLVDDLLDVSRITRGKLQLRKEEVELAPIVQQSLEESQPLVDKYRHQLEVSLPADRVLLHADAARLAQVLSNLLNNACKYTPSGGHIKLTALADESELQISVTDTGVGIPPEKLSQVFEMFTQLDQTLERSQGGLGIGLGLVKRLVEMHGGSITAQSDGTGRGSEFVVRLPVLSQQRSEKKSPPAAARSMPVSRRILIVDDNRDSANSLAMLLKMTGADTRVAYDGLDAVSTASQFAPDLVLLDIGLPKLNGYDACRQIRGQTWGQEMVLIALTGWGQEDDRRQSREAGFNYHMVKPVDFANLTRLIAELKPAGRNR